MTSGTSEPQTRPASKAKSGFGFVLLTLAGGVLGFLIATFAKEFLPLRETMGVLSAWDLLALPVLWPSLLGTLALLFANAFGAVATAIALTGSSLSIAPIVLFAQIRGDVLNDPHLGYAIAFAMILLTAIANAIYILLRMRAERWVK